MGMFLKERKRLLGVDIVLWSITLLLASIFGAGLLSKTKDVSPHTVRRQAVEKAPEQADLNYRRSVDLLEVELNHSWFIYNLPGPIKSLALLSDGAPEFFFSQERATQYQMSALRVGHESDPYVTARLLILLHENGEDWKKLISNFQEKNGQSDEFLRAVEAIYLAEQSKKSADVANKDKLEISDTTSSNSMSTAGAIVVIERSTDSWYRTAVLSTAYQDDRKKLAVIEEQKQNRCNLAVAALSFYHLLVAAASVAGILILWKFIRNRKPHSDKPISFSFRQIYACILAFFCTMVFMAFNHTAINEQCRRLFSSSSWDFGLHNGSILAVLVTFVVTIVALTSAWLFALKPDHISWRRILLGSPELNLGQVAAYGVGGFCVGTMLLQILIVINNQIDRSFRPPNDFLEIFIIGSPILSTLLILAYCVAGPLAEEIIFRVVLYGWMRQRLNVVVSVVAINIIFALYHCNLPLFITYFTLGVIFTVVYERTRSLAACWLSHCLWNLLVNLEAYLKLCL